MVHWRSWVAMAGGMVALWTGVPASAHHSIAAYDREHPVTVTGTLKQFRFTNPHTWLILMVADNNGVESEWDLVGNPGTVLVRQGWSRNTIRPGMKLTLLIAPRRDGAGHGEWVQLLEIDGQRFTAPRR